MAIQGCSFSPHFIFHQSAPLRKPLSGMVMLRKTGLPVKKTTRFQITCCIKDLVFEDHSAGIICYKNDRGEIICEGFDEGPRLQPQYPSTLLPSRDDAEIHDSLQQRLLQILDGETANSNALLGNKSCNGFNTLH
ncbi:hypothetical protein SOVF_001960 [Spinacia oleracea]|uniref:Uncharacterized protein n=1 Tax=Spinacia oleracea TaxID=3562 RepID=A0A9R0IDT9_SPIOL|nr:uncharacterized protein LOC110787205 [Spinacia oleracea]KNA25951.1 hypothetical protein SOVF_001960 [Spinacia oleracea]